MEFQYRDSIPNDIIESTTGMLGSGLVFPLSKVTAVVTACADLVGIRYANVDERVLLLFEEHLN